MPFGTINPNSLLASLQQMKAERQAPKTSQPRVGSNAGAYNQIVDFSAPPPMGNIYAAQPNTPPPTARVTADMFSEDNAAPPGLAQRMAAPSRNLFERTPDQIESMNRVYAPYTRAPEPMPVATRHGEGTERGFLARLKDILKGQVLMGPFGGIAAAISPQMAHNAQYRLQTRPEFMQAQEFQSNQATAGLNRLQDVEQATGLIPGTDIPSARTVHYQGQLQTMLDRMNLTAAQAEERIRQSDERLAETARQHNLQDVRAGESRRLRATRMAVEAANAGVPLTPALQQELLNVGLDYREFTPGAWKYFVDDSGNVTRVPVPKNISAAPTSARGVPGARGRTTQSGGTSGDPRFEERLERDAETEARHQLPKEPEPPTTKEITRARRGIGDKTEQELQDDYRKRHDAWLNDVFIPGKLRIKETLRGQRARTGGGAARATANPWRTN